MVLKLKQRLKAAVQAFREGVWWPATGGIDADEEGWRRLSGNADRDLSPLAQERVLQVVYYLFETDPLARRIIQMARDYIVAEGVGFKAEDDRVQDLLSRTWKDPMNSLELHLPQQVLELGLWGEQCYPVFVNPINGFVRFGYLDPAMIDTVKLDPNNAKIVKEVQLIGNGAEKGRTLKAINMDLDGFSPGYGLRSGDCFYFRVNSVTTASRGRSDLIALADYLDLYNQFLFNRGERAAFSNAWVWDVMLRGADETKIKEWLQKNPPPKPGSVRAHNENVEWRAVAPDLKAHDATYDARMIKNYILGGAGFPEHFFAEGGETTRATAAEMGEPVVKHLTSRQVYVKIMLREQCEFAIDQAQMHGGLPLGINREFDLSFPEISSKDMAKIGTVMVQAAQALMIAETQGWVTPENAARCFCEIATLLGPELQPEENIEEKIPPGPPLKKGGGNEDNSPLRQALKRVK